MRFLPQKNFYFFVPEKKCHGSSTAFHGISQLFISVSDCFLFLYILRRLCRNEYAGFLFFVFMKCSFLSCLNTEFHLRVNLGFASFIRLHISSIRLQNMSFYIILKLQIKYMLQLFLNLLIFHRSSSSMGKISSTRLSRLRGIQSALPI